MSAEGDSGVMGSIGLYKRAARMSKENALLLPTEEGRRRGLSAVEEVTTALEARFASDRDSSPLLSRLDAADLDDTDFDHGLLVSAEEIVEELRR